MSLYIHILKEEKKNNKWEHDKSFSVSQQLNSVAVAEYMDYFGIPVSPGELSEESRRIAFLNSQFAYILNVNDDAKECLDNAIKSYAEEYGEKSDYYTDSNNFKENIKDLKDEENVRYIVYFD